MKKYAIAALLASLSAAVLLPACSKSDAGPAGPEATGGVIMLFQEGLYPNESASSCQDTVIESAFPGTNYAINMTGWVGKNAGSRERLLMKFDISALPAGASILSAEIILFVSSINGGAGNFSMRRLTADFDEPYATWNTRANTFTWNSAGGDFTADKAGPSVNVDALGAVTWSINPSIVQAWADNPAVNYGLIMVSDSEATTEREIRVILSENTEEYNRPMLVVKYR